MKPRTAVCIAFLLLLSACEDRQAQQGKTSIAPDVPSADGANDQRARSEFKPNINAFDFRAAGDVQKRYDYEEKDLILTGGCGGGRMGLGFSDTSKAMQPDFFHFSFETGDLPTGRLTGATPITKVDWTNGMVFDPRINNNVANHFIGTGTVTIHTNEGRAMNGRLAGKVVAQVESVRTGETAAINALFDINLGCVL